ncbi:MAG: hypothetical protein EHM60_12395 [Lysobacterales bacterium]|nr:MAG: hypothetical protein EHM60_12395 [Xanthomonadales bacterium]
MSDPRDTSLSGGDARIDAAWRSASREEPPARVDETILAAARDAVRGESPRRIDRARPAWWQRWQPLAAAAGVAGLALVLAQRLPTDAEPDETARTPVAESMRPESKPGVAAEDAPAARFAPESASPSAPAEPDRAVAPAPPAATVETANTTASRPALVQQGPAAKAAGQRLDDAPHSPAGAAVDAAASSVVSAPEQWATRIHALHASGQLERATEELREFRRLHPDADAYLPQELRAWAASVDADPSG